MFTSWRNTLVAFAVLLSLFEFVKPADCELPALIAREVLFGNPQRADAKISPDGKSLAWLQPDTHGVLQIWVQTIDKNDARMVSAEQHRGIQSYNWAWEFQKGRRELKVRVERSARVQ